MSETRLLVLTLTALVGLVASTMMLVHRWFAFLRRTNGRLPISSLVAQRVFVLLPLLWLALFVALVLNARVAYGEWPGPRRLVGWHDDPTWPNPDRFGALILGYRFLTVAIVLGWILFVPLALHTWSAGQTPRVAGMPAYLALHAAIVLFWVWDPGHFVAWAMD